MVKQPIYTKAKDLPEGSVLLDLRKQEWTLGPVIGQGGFGCIYTAKSSTSHKYDKVIKIEPKANGPLFTEINFCQRVGKDNDIRNFMKEKKLEFLGMPRFNNFGVTDENRFLVMDRFGEDLHKTLMKSHITHVCLLQITLNILDVLEYIHSMEYAHADIKALNIMRGYLKPSEVYLLDFGMVSKFSENGKHILEKIDPKCKHNGTIEFSARDSHAGLKPSRRGDIESLLFNLVFWLSWDDKNPNSSRSIGHGKLPWLSILKGSNSAKIPITTINKVAETKVKYMENTASFVKYVGLDIYWWSKYIVKMLDKVNSYKYADKPDYDSIRDDIADIISEITGKPKNVNANRKICWSSESSPIKTRNSRKRSSYDLVDNINENNSKKKRMTPVKPLNNDNIENHAKVVTSKVLKKRVVKKGKNIFKDSDSESEFETSVSSKQIIRGKKGRDDSAVISKSLKKNIENGSMDIGESSFKENILVPDSCDESKEQLKLSEIKKVKKTKKTVLKGKFDNKIVVEVTKMADSKNVSSKEIIPGLKQLSKIRELKKEITREPELVTSSIIPGQKMLDALKERRLNEKMKNNSPKENFETDARIDKSSPLMKSKLNSVSCQTTPSILDNK